MTIRMIEAGDRAAWAGLWTQYLAFYETTLPEAVFERTWARLLDADEPIWGALALVEGRPVGLVHYLYHRSTWLLDDTCYLQDLFVMPEGRGAGFGRALIEHVYAQAAHLGAPRVYWNTHETNITARALYDRVATRSGFIQYRKALG